MTLHFTQEKTKFLTVTSKVPISTCSRYLSGIVPRPPPQPPWPLHTSSNSWACFQLNSKCRFFPLPERLLPLPQIFTWLIFITFSNLVSDFTCKHSPTHTHKFPNSRLGLPISLNLFFFPWHLFQSNQIYFILLVSLLLDDSVLFCFCLFPDVSQASGIGWDA